MNLLERFKQKGGWCRVFALMVEGYFTNHIGRTAAAMTYYFLFAIFPFLIVVTSLLGLMDLPALTFEGEITRFLPKDVVLLLNTALFHITKNSSNAWLTFGLVLTVWFPYRAVSNLMEVVNDIYDGKALVRRVHPLRILFVAVLLVVLIPMMVLFLVVGERVLLFVSQYVPLSLEFIREWNIMRFLPLSAALLFVLCMVYFLSPTLHQPVRYVLPGAVLSVLAWMLFSLLFSFYVDNIASYSVVYGSIGVMIALLVWMNCSMIAMLMGAVCNVALRQTFAT